MNPPNPSLCQQLINSCFPETVRHIDIFYLLIEPNLKTLESQVALNILNSACALPEKRRKLEEIINSCNNLEVFSPFFFGNSPALRLLILQSIECSHFLLHVTSNEIRFVMLPAALTVDFEPEEFIFYKPMILEIACFLFDTNVSYVQFEFEEDPNSDHLVNQIISMSLRYQRLVEIVSRIGARKFRFVTRRL